ncbi:MAG: hypothetical protein PHD65_01030 [Gallionella sp.]|nr:hypothetical protein [Gallionella sp.]
MNPAVNSLSAARQKTLVPVYFIAANILGEPLKNGAVLRAFRRKSSHDGGRLLDRHEPEFTKFALDGSH